MTRSSHPLTSRHVSPSLLFQFVLIESFHIKRQLQSLEHIISALTDSDAIKESITDHFTELNQVLTILVGQSQGHLNTFGWNHELGVLNKWHHYFLFFVRAKENTQNPKLLALQNRLHEVLLLTLQCRDFLHLIHEPEIEVSTSQYKQLLLNLSSIHDQLTALIKDIVGLISEFEKDEGLLFFLLRYQESIHELCGAKFLNSLLLLQFPKGLQELETFLHEKYSARSFHHVLPLISEKLALLQYDRQK